MSPFFSNCTLFAQSSKVPVTNTSLAAWGLGKQSGQRDMFRAVQLLLESGVAVTFLKSGAQGDPWLGKAEACDKIGLATYHLKTKVPIFV